MKNLFKAAVMTAVLGIGSAIPMMAQIENGLDFTTTFPFYAQNTKLPAGSYKVIQTDFDANTLLIESVDGKHSAFVDFVPTQSNNVHNHTDVTFQKIGDADYLNRVWVEGQSYGMKVEPTKAEKKEAQTVAAEEHSASGTNR